MRKFRINIKGNSTAAGPPAEMESAFKGKIFILKFKGFIKRKTPAYNVCFILCQWFKKTKS